MELTVSTSMNGDIQDLEKQQINGMPIRDDRPSPARSKGIVRYEAYQFDGLGRCTTKDWDLCEGGTSKFCWYHVNLPKINQTRSMFAQNLIAVLCPPLKLQDILNLARDGPYCAHVDGALVFRVNSTGPGNCKYTVRLAARVTENSVITVSLGEVNRLEFLPTGQTLLSDIPIVDSPTFVRDENGESTGFVIREHELDFFLRTNQLVQADNPIPTSVSNLVVHIIDRHVDKLESLVTDLETELDTVEGKLEGSSVLKKQMLDERTFPTMQLDLQRLLQAVSHGEQVFPRVKEKCSSKSWFVSDDITALDEQIGRLRRLKEKLGFITNRVTAVQAGLDSWQSEQINRKLYYLSVLSMIFLPLSIVTGVFGMNVGGVPWTSPNNPFYKDGFLNVMFICVVMLLLILGFFTFSSLYTRISSWRRERFIRSSSLNGRAFLKRTLGRGASDGREYTRLPM